jgi:hypothetical protein
MFLLDELQGRGHCVRERMRGLEGPIRVKKRFVRSSGAFEFEFPAFGMNKAMVVNWI